MPSAFIGAGLARGAAGVPEAILRREEATARRDLSQQKLEDYKAKAPIRESEQQLEVQQLKNELRKTQTTGMQQMTFEAFNSYDSDKNTRHLNNMLTRAKQNPIGARMFANAVRYDSVERNKESENELKRLGISDIDGFFAEPNNFVTVTESDGSRKMIDMDKVYAMTGYTKHMNDMQLKRMTEQSLIMQRMKQGQTRSSITALERIAKLKAEAEGIPVHQAYEELKKGSAKTATTETERLAAKIREANPELSYVESIEQALETKRSGSGMEREARRIAKDEGRPFNEVFEEVKTRKERTTAQKSIDEIDIARDKLDKEFDGAFLEADLSKQVNRNKASRLVARIEKDFPMSAKDRATAVEIRQLTGLTAIAGAKLTDKEAGPLDSLFRDTKKFISNDISGTEGPAAYEAFRNTMRHALAGSAQSVQETANFQKAMGSLREQLGPVLVKFKVQVEELKAKLQAVYDMNDPYVAKYRLNMDQDKIAKVINALEDRIDLIDTAKPRVDAETLAPSAKKKTIGEYFN